MVYLNGLVAGVVFLVLGSGMIYLSTQVAQLFLMIYSLGEPAPNSVADWLVKGVGAFVILLGLLIIWASLQQV